MKTDYTDLLFPLNVYASLLAEDFGVVDALHFGLFTDTANTLPMAQQQATELLLAQLPAQRSGKFLEVGTGLGALLARLLSGGYDALGINPDAAQVRIARERYGINEQHLLCAPFEEAALEEEAYSCVVFQESSQYIDQTILFQLSSDVLVTGGRLVVMDEFMYHCSHREQRRLHYLSAFLDQARRCGFSLRHRQDLGPEVLGTLCYLKDALAEHGEHIRRKLRIDPNKFAALQAEVSFYLSKYIEGSFGYALFSFEKRQKQAYKILPAVSKDSEKIRSLFTRIFSQPLTSEYHAWKYVRGRAMLAWQESKLVGHYGGMERDILYRGRLEIAVQIGDVMVAREHRLRKGPFWLMAKAFADMYVGDCAPFLLSFGFPNQRAMKLGRLLGLYAQVDSMVQVIAGVPVVGIPSPFLRLLELDAESLSFHSSAVDALWQEMAACFDDSLIGLRDAGYLRRRYLEHPNMTYRIIAVVQRISGRFIGVIVVREGEGNDMLLMDILAPPGDLATCLRQATRIAGLSGKKRLVFWLTRSMAERYCSSSRYLVEQSDISVPMISCTPGPLPEDVKKRWWLTAGDMDFF